jgi:hypothetical protein
VAPENSALIRQADVRAAVEKVRIVFFMVSLNSI